MLWLRSLGMVLVVGATTLMGIGFYLKEKYRLQDLKLLEQAMLQIQQQIAYMGSPLPEVFSCVGVQMGGQMGAILEEIAKQMQQHTQETAEEIWTSVWLEQAQRTYFIAEDLDMMIQFGKLWGGWDKQKQQNNMTYFIKELQQKQQILQKKLEKNGKMYCGIGVLGGLMLVVVLL